MTNFRRRELCMAAMSLALPRTSEAQARPRAHRVAHLSGSGEVASKPLMAAFRQGMRMLGHVEDKTWSLEERYAEGRIELVSELARDLVQRGPDLLLTSTTPASLAAKAATSTVPVVMVLVADPVGAGIVSSLSRPGGNITGVTNIVAELAGKRLELLKELVPLASRIAVMINPDSQNAPLQMRSAEAAARSLGIELQPVLEVRRAADLERAFESARQAQAAGMIRMIDPAMLMMREPTSRLAIQHHMPVIYPAREDVVAGGLLSYGTNVPGQYRQAAGLVDKILKGARPGELPVEQPTKFEFVINMNTARALRLVVPPALLLRADEVIE